MAESGTTPRRAGSLAENLAPRLALAPALVRAGRLTELATAARTARAEDVLRPYLSGAVGAFLASVAEYSPFLRSLMLQAPARLADVLGADPWEHTTALAEAAVRSWQGRTEAELMTALREVRAEVAMTVALADLGGLFDLEAVTGALTRFADAAVSAAVNLLLVDSATSGRLTLTDPENPALNSGWLVLGMGKLGAAELNYSSDIDLIVLFDGDRVRVAGDDAQRLFVRMTQRLVTILQQRTADGYVFRVDLRLRPDPGSTAIALSTEAALIYYEGLGQNWERAALIKARPVAGDIAAGVDFLSALRPYIWRKYLDYTAIADIHSIKRQIHDHRGHGEVAIAGHNLKLGRGGIREIEFFVQTQQLIAGGRNPQLRGRRTLDMLAALAEGGWIDAATSDDLRRSYDLLRTFEHRLQMVADEQTHTLPEEEKGLAVIARLAGYRGTTDFAAALRQTLLTVSARYSALFESAPTLTSAVGNLVFTGDADDPETLEALSRLGYRRPSDITRIVRQWHFGRYPAVRSATARERLTDFVPLLIEALSKTDNADTAFLAFDRFLARVPAGAQLFALFQSNPQLLALLSTILAVAPRLAETVAARPQVLDALIEPDSGSQLPDREALAARLAASLTEARSYEDVLNRARAFRQEQMFLIGARLLAGTVTPRQAGHAYSDLAETVVSRMYAAVGTEFEVTHGTVAGGATALLALGRLGGREMTASSDLDLILLYDFAEGVAASDGPRPLPPVVYFTRLTQRLVSALTAPTPEGTLYAVDFRLRPSGKSGPLATHMDAFAAYQANEAWTWEHMALTRARPIAGEAVLCEQAREVIGTVLRKPRDHDKVIADVLDMRAMIEGAKGGEGPWDLKQAPGGLVDIEFIAQSLQLLHAAQHPEIVSTDTETSIAMAARVGVLAAVEADVLLPALGLLSALIQVLRLSVEHGFIPGEAPAPLLDRLAEVADVPDFRSLEAHLRATQSEVRASFERVLGKVPSVPPR